MARTKQYLGLREIQELIKMLGKSNVSEITIERENFKITLRTHDPHGSVPQVTHVNTSLPQTATQPINQPPASSPVTKESLSAPEPSKTSAEDESKYITIKSPMIGTFFRASGPDKPPFINVGDEIKPGSVLCVIEAMKLFNEIESENTGRIVKILVENAKPVEYDQPLFLIEPV
jgi:acetyl-CoA carboxylase biotin carboxyl carrier protein